MTARKPRRTVKCFCGKTLESVRANRKHCSSSCRVRACLYRRWLAESGEQTEADLDELVARQMRKLPLWWDRCHSDE